MELLPSCAQGSHHQHCSSPRHCLSARSLGVSLTCHAAPHDVRPLTFPVVSLDATSKIIVVLSPKLSNCICGVLLFLALCFHRVSPSSVSAGHCHSNIRLALGHSTKLCRSSRGSSNLGFKFTEARPLDLPSIHELLDRLQRSNCICLCDHMHHGESPLCHKCMCFGT